MYARSEGILLRKLSFNDRILYDIDQYARNSCNTTAPHFPLALTLEEKLSKPLSRSKEGTNFISAMKYVFDNDREGFFGKGDQPEKVTSPTVWFARPAQGLCLYIDDVKGTSKGIDVLDSVLLFGDAGSGASTVLPWDSYLSVVVVFHSKTSFILNALRNLVDTQT